MVNEAHSKLYTRLHSIAPPQQTQYGSSSASILSEARGFMTGFDFTMQLQVGCPGGCLFCYVPAGSFLAPVDAQGEMGREWGFHVRNKDQAAARFGRHLLSAKLADKTLYWSGVTDPYASAPVVTSAMWQHLQNTPAPLRPRRIVVQTRFRVDRDVEAIAAYARTTQPADGGPPVVVSFSIGTDRTDLIRAWERATPDFEQRMQAVTNLRKAETFVVVTLSPFGLWNDLSGAMARLKALGVAYVTVLFFKENTASANTPRPFLTYLRAEYPQLLEPEWQAARLAEIQHIFGAERVLVGQAGFASLASPQQIVAR